jgi:hypothetical protein
MAGGAGSIFYAWHLLPGDTDAGYPRPLPLTEFLPSPEKQRLLETGTGQPTFHEAIFAPRPMLTAQHAQDAVVERWSDGVLDVLVRNFLT